MSDGAEEKVDVVLVFTPEVAGRALIDILKKFKRFSGEDAQATRDVLALLGDGADLGLRAEDGSTALHLAADNFLPGIVSALLAAGAAVDVQNDAGNTPLMYAAAYMDMDTFDLLTAAGADPNLARANGETALMIAASWSGDKTRRLLDAGADIQAVSAAGLDALAYALRPLRQESVAALLAAGADPLRRLPEGCALDMARESAAKAAKELEEAAQAHDALAAGDAGYDKAVTDLAMARDHAARAGDIEQMMEARAAELEQEAAAARMAALRGHWGRDRASFSLQGKSPAAPRKGPKP